MMLTLAPFARSRAPSEGMAWSLLQRAQGFIQKWPEGFRGYRAQLRCRTADCAVEGAVVVACGREPVLDLEPPGLSPLIRARLAEHVEERTPRFFKDGDGRFAVHADPGADGGRWIRVERQDATLRYQLDARGRIEAIERLERDRAVLTVVEEYARATPGRVLPARRRRTTRDLRTDAFLGREHLVESHCRLDHVWLPGTWELTAETTTGSQTLRLELFAHQLL